MYERVSNLLEYENIDNRLALLHSDIYSKYNENEHISDENLMIYANETKKLSIPLTISTLDQIFNFVFKYNGYEINLATLSYSKIVIDEIQMYSPELLAFLIFGLRKIDELGGRFAILTATLPPFILNILNDEVKLLKGNKKIDFKYKKFINNELQRHNLKILKEKIHFQFIKNLYLKVDGKVLVICNTVTKAQQLYNELFDSGIENLNIIHSKFIKKDRSNLEEAITEFGKNDNKKLVYG